MTGLMMVDSQAAPAATCLVCAKDIPAGEGVTAWYGDRMLRFRCPGCYARFEANPQPYLTGQTGGCCGEGHDGSSQSDPRRHPSART